jgi:hypothetical protein
MILGLAISFTMANEATALSDVQNNFVNTGQINAVMSDADFIDINSMTVDQIQAFLNSYGSYLKDYVDNSDEGRGRTAAQIIWDTAHGKYGASGSLNGIVIDESTGTVSPKVILTYLQKEQSLVETTPEGWQTKTAQEGYDTLAWAMTASMGYQCYAGVSGDGNGNNCKDSTEGFVIQVEYGAWQLRYAYARAQGYGFPDYQVGQTIITSDGYSVLLTNRATSSIYRYTPYVFNSAFNVWNIFYNRYQFGTSPAPTIPPPPPSPPPRKAGDVNGDSVIDSTDLSVLADQWGKNVTANTGADFNGDGLVDSTDLSILADAWGK